MTDFTSGMSLAKLQVVSSIKYSLGVLLTVAIAGCAAQPEDTLEGKLSSNGLTINLAALDLLSSEPLALTSGGELRLNEDAFGDLLQAEGGVELLSYIATCALEEGEVLTTSTGQSLEGNLGLATEWAAASCDSSCQGWVSACLLAHANAFGMEVSISPRASHPGLDWNQAIERKYSYQEAAFYGNLFLPAGQRVMQACGGIGLYSLPGDGSGGYGDFLKGRVCGVGECEFSFAGACQDSLITGLPDVLNMNVCTEYQSGYFSECKEVDDELEDPPPGPSHAEVITVFLDS